MLYNSQRSDPMGDGSPTPFDQKGKGRALQNGDILALDLDSAEEGSGGSNGNAFMQMQLVEQQVCPFFSILSKFIERKQSRIHIYSSARLQLNPSRQPSLNSARYLPNSPVWSQSKEKPCSESTPIPRTSPQTWIQVIENF